MEVSQEHPHQNTGAILCTGVTGTPRAIMVDSFLWRRHRNASISMEVGATGALKTNCHVVELSQEQLGLTAEMKVFFFILESQELPECECAIASGIGVTGARE